MTDLDCKCESADWGLALVVNGPEEPGEKVGDGEKVVLSPSETQVSRFPDRAMEHLFSQTKQAGGPKKWIWKILENSDKVDALGDSTATC